jgi:hypothetical protein
VGVTREQGKQRKQIHPARTSRGQIEFESFVGRVVSLPKGRGSLRTDYRGFTMREHRGL